jgi:hypothetical protein
MRYGPTDIPSAIKCNECGALVAQSGREEHDLFHLNIAGLVTGVNKLIGIVEQLVPAMRIIANDAVTSGLNTVADEVARRG